MSVPATAPLGLSLISQPSVCSDDVMINLVCRLRRLLVLVFGGRVITICTNQPWVGVRFVGMKSVFVQAVCCVLLHTPSVSHDTPIFCLFF